MSANDKVPSKSRAKRPQPKGGSRKGIPNKVPAEVKTMVLQALSEAGGVEYLLERAKDPRTQAAFMTLVGKVIPTQITGEGGGPVQTFTRIELVGVAPR